MKVMTKAGLALLALGTSAAIMLAQDNTAPAQDGDQPPPGPPAGRGFRPHRPPPIIGVLDANHDGVIDADEIANAPAALKTLDKNGDGKLTMDELMGPRPMRGAGRGDHQGPPPPPDDAPPPSPDSGN
ncbi:MAG TPA: EF-hand domain-containing protein [Verrucomicrobiae bacterium]|nr:EF-hand domain-containing protein [Verrucomicrobiae bacterium]